MPRRIETTGGNSSGLSRRQWLGMLGIGGTAAMAGCIGGSGDDDDDDGTGDPTEEITADEPDPLDLSQEPPEVSGEYIAVQGSGFDTLNPIYNTEAGAGTAIGYALSQGYTFDPDGEVFPLLYDLSSDDDGQTWVFELRDGLYFSEPYGQVTAEDFVYLIQELHQTEWASTANAIDWQGVEVEQTGELEFQATLPSPNILWPETFDPLEYPIPKDLIEPYVEEEDVDGLRQNEELIELEFTGNLGAYKLDEWVRDGGTTYTRNDEYFLRDLAEDDSFQMFAEAPYFETAQIDIIEEESSRIAAIETGAADNVPLPPDRGEQFIEDEDTMVVLEPTPFNNILSVNMRDNGWTAGPGNLFQVKEFRQAVTAAIDKPRLIEGVYRGFHDPHYTWQPEFSEWFPGTDELTLWGDPENGVYGDDARDLAEQAVEQVDEDYAYDGDVLVDPDGNQVELQFYYNAASETQELAADFFADEFEEHLGFTLSTNAIDGTRFSEQYWSAEETAEPGTSATIDGEEVVWDAPSPNNPGPREYTPNESWDFSSIFGLNTYPRNPLTNQVFFDGPATMYNPVGYYPEFDAEGLMADARQAQDRDELQDVLNELFVNLNEEQPYIMLTFGSDIEAYNPDVRGPIADFASGWDFGAWHFDE